MNVTITSEIHHKLEKIGFEKDEINAIEFILRLRTGKGSKDITVPAQKMVSADMINEFMNKIKEFSWEMGEKSFRKREELYDRKNIL